MIKKIILVFKTHFDIGFTDLASNVIRKYSDSMLRDVVETCKATENMGKLRYVWTMPSWPLKEVFLNCGIEMRQELIHYIKNGQIVWHALPFTSHTDFCGEEEYLEGLRYGRELSEYFHKPYPISAKMTDVPGHGLMLPEILAGAGIKFLHLGCNAFATPPKVPELFYWQAKSGKRILTMYGKGGYGSSLLPNKEWKYPVWMALMSTHDNCGPQSAVFIQDMVRKAKQAYPDVEVVCGSMDDFIMELSECDLSDLPVITKDMADTWIHGIGSYPKETGCMRELRRKSIKLQKLEVLRAMGEQSETSEEFQALCNSYYETMHLFGEHTWGADVKTWLGINRVYEKEEFLKEKNKDNYRFMEESWQEQKSRATACKESVDKLKIALEKGKEGEYFLFNSATNPFTGWVSIEAYKNEFYDKAIFINDTELQVTILQGELSCYVMNLKPLETTKLKIQNKKTAPFQLNVFREKNTTNIENHRYVLTFDEHRGVILELFDKKLQCSLMKQQGKDGIFSYQYTRYGIKTITEYLRKYGYRFSYWGIQDYGRDGYPECDNKSFYPKYDQCIIDGDTVRFYYHNEISVEKYGDAEKIQLDITLPCAGDEIFVTMHVRNKQETPFVEEGTIKLPFSEHSSGYLLNKPGAVIDPKEEIVQNANHVFYALENFAAASDDTCGVCVIGKDTPLLSIGETGVYKYRRKYKETAHSFYYNLFNNMWGTNFPQWVGGNLTYRFILFGYEKREETQLMERSRELSGEVEVTTQEIRNIGLTIPEQMDLLNIRQEHECFVLRLKDLSGKVRSGKITLPGYNIVAVDYYLRQKDSIKREEYDFEIQPYGIFSFLVKQYVK